MSNQSRVPNLMDEYPLLVYPSLAKVMGINKAIVFQQLHFLLCNQKTAKNEYVFVDGKWWVYNTYEEWQEGYFDWLSEVTLKRIFLELEKSGLVISRQSVKNKSDRRKWYSIDYELWNKIKITLEPSDQNDTMVDEIILIPSIVSKVSDGYSETTTETTPENLSRKREKVSKPDTIPATLMNPMKDAIVSAFGWQPDKMTNSEWGIVQATAKELCTAGLEPERVMSFYVWCKAKFTNFSPKAMATHLSEYRETRLDTPSTQPLPESIPTSPIHKIDADFNAWLEQQKAIS